VAILSPSFRSQPRLDDHRGNGDGATNTDCDPNEAGDTDRQRAAGEPVADRKNEKQQRADEPPQQARFATWAHASG